MRWTRKSIIAEIKRLHTSGEELYYSKAEDNHLNLVRAAGWHFGTWRRAVESAGIDYESLSRYQRWNKKKIVERIRELHAQGQSLHWRAVSTEIDPPLAAAALRPNGYSSWRDAIAASGLDIESVARYKEWDNAKVLKAIRSRKRSGLSMFSKSLQTEDQSLFCAARRRFGSWDGALNAAGFKAENIRLRKFNPALNAPRKKKDVLAARNGSVSANGKATGKITLVTKAAPAAKTAPVKAAPAKGAKAAATKTVATKAPAKKAVAAKAPAKKVAKAPVKVAAKKAVKAPVKGAAKKAPAKKAPVKTTAKAPAKVAAKKATKAPLKAAKKTPAKKAPAKRGR